MKSEAGPAPGRRRVWPWLLGGSILLVAALVAAYELIASPIQAMLLANYGKGLTYETRPGPSDQIAFPEHGPYDIRLGYTLLPMLKERLDARGYAVSRQARISDEMSKLARFGLYLPYIEKNAAGLELQDCSDSNLYRHRSPNRVYQDFDAIPPVIANTLLFIENRELLDPNHPQRNPAVEWDRLAQAVLEKAVQVFNPGRNVPGGSTLATQIEKYRHSPDGLTMTAGDKVIQMVSASVRAYLDGTDTRATRRRIVLDYLNTVPLAAAPGFGEVHGIGDALDAWFGIPFDGVNQRLANPAPDQEAARLYRHVLALLVAQRKPSWYLLAGRANLEQLVDVHLDLLANAGIITHAFRDLAKSTRLHFGARGQARKDPSDFMARKATNALRTEISQLLDIPRLYDLDRLDLSVRTTLHSPSQQAVTDVLRRLNDPGFLTQNGLYGQHLLSSGNDLGKILYSFTLYELSESGALLRVQADNLDQPFDINKGAKLDMGSSAKLRTLITYLELVSELHQQYSAMTPAQLSQVKADEKDALTRWAIQYLRQANRQQGLEAMLEAAMNRAYSASPAETFWTGGGLHSFVNFNKEDDGKVMNLWEATRNSVNLPFIRLMRDMVRHLIFRNASPATQILGDPASPERKHYLQRFADKEGKEFLGRYYRKYKGRTPAETTDLLLNHLSANPRRLAAVFRYLEPNQSLAGFTQWMQSRLTAPERFKAKDFEKLYLDYGPDKFNLSDRAYIAQVHPLELWLVAHLRRQPGSSWNSVVKASFRERLDVYEWLYSAASKDAQDSRIQSLLEIEAFQDIHKRWRRMGYPFGSLVPSYATSIGSSADRPAALAELMGILLNDGVKLPTATLRKLDFAAGTPYHTVFERTSVEGERILPAPLARVVRKALTNVVREGTARRLHGVFKTSQGPLVVGGKTGTGDHRKDTYSSTGVLLDSKVMNRVATFAFFLGERHYGAITAFVPGEAAADYRFTSGLPVQLLKILAPSLDPLLRQAAGRERTWPELVAAFEEETRPPPPAPAPLVVTPPAAPVPPEGTVNPVSAGEEPSLPPASPEQNEDKQERSKGEPPPPKSEEMDKKPRPKRKEPPPATPKSQEPKPEEPIGVGHVLIP